MTTWIVLLRGINVGGNNRLAMADLRALVATLGHADVSTYIQSGNIVMTSSRSDRSTIATEICDGIAASFGPKVSAVLRTPDELRNALASNPFTASGIDGKHVYITFFSDKPPPDAISTLESDRFLPDRFEVIGSELFGYYPDGSGRSKMTLEYFEKRLHVHGTARNLNTVAKLIELAGG